MNEEGKLFETMTPRQKDIKNRAAQGRLYGEDVAFDFTPFQKKI